MQIAAIVNRSSRNGSLRSLCVRLEHEFRTDSLGWYEVSGPGESTQLARALVQCGADTIVAVGGDGTVNAVINGIVGSDCRLGIVPVGTANDLARCLGIPQQIAAACSIIRHGTTRSIDLICVNGWYYATAGGIGLPADVVHWVDHARVGTGPERRLAHLAGAGIYCLAMCYQLLCGGSAARTVVLRLDGRTIHLAAHAVLVSNVPRIGRHMKIAPRARVDDGKLHIYALAAASRLGLTTSALRTFTRAPERSGCVRIYSGRHLRLETAAPASFCADGELKSLGLSLTFDVLPRGIRLACPA